MERAREELHAEAMRNKAAKDNAIKENCPPLPDISAMAEGRYYPFCLWPIASGQHKPLLLFSSSHSLYSKRQIERRGLMWLDTGFYMCNGDGTVYT